MAMFDSGFGNGNILEQLLQHLKQGQQQFTADDYKQNPMLMYMPQQQSAGATLAQSLPFYNYSQNLGQYQKPAQQLLSAMTDTNNPQYQQIYGQQKQQGQQNLAESIAELSRQNRKLQVMGRSPLLDDERGGEATFRTLTKGYQDVQSQAAGNTQNILGNAYTGAVQQGQQRQLNDYSKAGVNSGIFGALSKLFGL